MSQTLVGRRPSLLERQGQVALELGWVRKLPIPWDDHPAYFPGWRGD